MPAGPFTISKDFMHGTKEGCLRVTAVPHIILYRIPRDFATNLTAEPELKQAGIYLLMNTKTNTIYVGQADSRDNGNGVLGRMLESHTKKNEIDEWDVGFVLTNGTPTFFGATELNWLEQFFYDEALKAGNYNVLNGNRPHASAVTFSTRTLLNNYVDYAFFLLEEELHCDAFVGNKKGKRSQKNVSVPKEPVPVSQKDPVTDPKDKSVSEIQPVSALQEPVPVSQDNEESTELFFLNNEKRDAHAEGIRLEDNKMIVKKGAWISNACNLANQKGQAKYDELRNQLISDGTVKDRIFTTDYTFSSPSAAATVILGASSSGKEKWKNKDGVMLGDIVEK